MADPPTTAPLSGPPTGLAQWVLVSNPLSAYGAVDLSALAEQKKAQASAAQAAASAPAGVVIDVTAATFERDVIQQSMVVPVVLDLWAAWCGPCKQLSPVLERLAAQAGGRWVLAKVDVDAEQQIAAAFQVQSIPSVFAVIKGQPLPLFQGALPEAQIVQYLDALLAEAAKHGVSGRVGDAPGAAEEAAAAPVNPADEFLDAAAEAVQQADWAAAEAAYAKALEVAPDDPDATIGSKLVALYRRVDGKETWEVMQAALADPDDLQAQLLAADVEAINQDWPAAFDRLIGQVRARTGDERAAARTRLLELFEVAGPMEPSVAKARTDLANALF